MAKRRMFDERVVGSDSFFKLSPVAQNLYFRLNMKADDDGICDSVVAAMRITNSEAKDLQSLVKRGFLLHQKEFYIVAHWLWNNKLRKDRYHESDNLQSILIYLDDEGKFTNKVTDTQYLGLLKTEFKPGMYANQ